MDELHDTIEDSLYHKRLALVMFTLSLALILAALTS